MICNKGTTEEYISWSVNSVFKANYTETK